MPSAKLKGQLLLPALGLLPAQWLLLSSHGRFEEQAEGPTTVSVGTTAARKRELVSLASEIQLLGGRLIPLMGSGSLLISY